MAAARRSPILFVLFVVAAITVIAATQTPDFSSIRFSPEALEHAVARHGDDALLAISRTMGCGVENRRAKLCLKGRYGLTIAFWCQPPGAELCPGLYATIGGCGKTAFVRPCYQWKECQ